MNSMANAPLFDRAAMLDNLGDDVELLQLMARTFIDDVPRMFAELRSALAGGDAPALVRASHNLKGSAANFGAAPLVACMVALEGTGRAGDLGSARAGIDDAARLTAVLVAELRRELPAP
jgi:HPt (histidine-containing phosphotransfer) domain-containing protein